MPSEGVLLVQRKRPCRARFSESLFFLLIFTSLFLTRPIHRRLGALLNATHLTRENYWALLLPSKTRAPPVHNMCDKLSAVCNVINHILFFTQGHAQNNTTCYLSYQIPTHHICFNRPWFLDCSLRPLGSAQHLDLYRLVTHDRYCLRHSHLGPVIYSSG